MLLPITQDAVAASVQELCGVSRSSSRLLSPGIYRFTISPGLPLDAFARRFKATTGQTPYGYVLERRLIRAESLLADSDRPLGDIALAVGFSSQSHFTATFRRMRVITPRAWRRQFCLES